ncbi:MAG TPA: RNB domain-containing ribonuclease [Elusimicrobiota bacterium]|nr:RNB domain-containing ribonuclease [Elusimicrobiota bacterium]
MRHPYIKIGFSMETLRRLAATGMASVFLFSTIGAPYAEAALYRPGEEPLPAVSTQFSHEFPREAGETADSHWFQREDPQTVYHIQDAHGMPAAQANAATIIRSFLTAPRSDQDDRSPDPLLVCVEGAVGEVPTDWLSAFPDDKVKARVAEFFLNQADLTGEEYLAMIHQPGVVRIVGVEDPDLYQRHLQTRTQTDSYRRSLSGPFQDVERYLAGVKQRVFPDSLRRLDRLQSDFEDQRISLHDYLVKLPTFIPAGFDWAAFPNVSLAVEVSRLERRLDTTVLQREREAVLRRVAETVSPQEAAVCLNAALDFRLGRLSPLDFTRKLTDWSKTTGTEAPQTRLYEEYLTLQQSLDQTRFAEELSRLQKDLFARLSDDPTVRRVLGLAEWTRLQGLYWSLSLSPKDWDRLQKMSSSVDWSSALKELSSSDWGGGLRPESSLRDLKVLLSSESDFARMDGLVRSYYELAHQRDAVLVGNTLKAMRREKSSRAVLVAGGFHTDGIVTGLRSQRVSYEVIRPSLTRPSAVVPMVSEGIRNRQRVFQRELERAVGALRSPSKLQKTFFQKQIASILMATELLAEHPERLQSFSKLIDGWAAAYPGQEGLIRDVAVVAKPFQREGRWFVAGSIAGAESDVPFIMGTVDRRDLTVLEIGEENVRRWIQDGAVVGLPADDKKDLAVSLHAVWPFMGEADWRALLGQSYESGSLDLAGLVQNLHRYVKTLSFPSSVTSGDKPREMVRKMTDTLTSPSAIAHKTGWKAVLISAQRSLEASTETPVREVPEAPSAPVLPPSVEKWMDDFVVRQAGSVKDLDQTDRAVLQSLGVSAEDLRTDGNQPDEWPLPDDIGRIDTTEEALQLLKSNPRYARYTAEDWAVIEKRYAVIGRILDALRAEFPDEELLSVQGYGSFINEPSRRPEDIDLFVTLKGDRKPKKVFLELESELDIEDLEVVAGGEKWLKQSPRNSRLTIYLATVARAGQTLWGQKIIESLPPVTPKNKVLMADLTVQNVDFIYFQEETLSASKARTRLTEALSLLTEAANPFYQPSLTAEEVRTGDLRDVLDDLYHEVAMAKKGVQKQAVQERLRDAWNRMSDEDRGRLEEQISSGSPVRGAYLDGSAADLVQRLWDVHQNLLMRLGIPTLAAALTSPMEVFYKYMVYQSIGLADEHIFESLTDVQVELGDEDYPHLEKIDFYSPVTLLGTGLDTPIQVTLQISDSPELIVSPDLHLLGQITRAGPDSPYMLTLQKSLLNMPAHVLKSVFKHELTEIVLIHQGFTAEDAHEMVLQNTLPEERMAVQLAVGDWIAAQQGIQILDQDSEGIDRSALPPAFWTSAVKITPIAKTDYAPYVDKVIADVALRLGYEPERDGLFVVSGDPKRIDFKISRYGLATLISEEALRASGNPTDLILRALFGAEESVSGLQIYSALTKLSGAKLGLTPDASGEMIFRLLNGLIKAHVSTGMSVSLAELVDGFLRAVQYQRSFPEESDVTEELLGELADLLLWNPTNPVMVNTYYKLILPKIVYNVTADSNTADFKGFWGEVDGIYSTVFRRRTALSGFELSRAITDVNWEVLGHTAARDGSYAVKEFDALNKNTVFEFKYRGRLKDLYSQLAGIDLSAKGKYYAKTACHLAFMVQRFIFGPTGRGGDLSSPQVTQRMGQIRNFVYHVCRPTPFLVEAVYKFLASRHIPVKVAPNGDIATKLSAAQFIDFIFDPENVRLFVLDAMDWKEQNLDQEAVDARVVSIQAALDGEPGRILKEAIMELDDRVFAQSQGKRRFDFIINFSRPPAEAMRFLRSAESVASRSETGSPLLEEILQSVSLSKDEVKQMRKINKTLELGIERMFRSLSPLAHFQVRSRGSTSRLTHVGNEPDYDLQVVFPPGWTDEKFKEYLLKNQGRIESSIKELIQKGLSGRRFLPFNVGRIEVGKTGTFPGFGMYATLGNTVTGKSDKGVYLLPVHVYDTAGRSVMKLDISLANSVKYANDYPDYFAKQLATVGKLGGAVAQEDLLRDIRLAKKFFVESIGGYSYWPKKSWRGHGPSGVGIEQMVMQSGRVRDEDKGQTIIEIGSFDRLMDRLYEVSRDGAGRKRSFEEAKKLWTVHNAFMAPSSFLEYLNQPVWDLLAYAAEQYHEAKASGTTITLGSLKKPQQPKPARFSPASSSKSSSKASSRKRKSVLGEVVLVVDSKKMGNAFRTIVTSVVNTVPSRSVAVSSVVEDEKKTDDGKRRYTLTLNIYEDTAPEDSAQAFLEIIRRLDTTASGSVLDVRKRAGVDQLSTVVRETTAKSAPADIVVSVKSKRELQSLKRDIDLFEEEIKKENIGLVSANVTKDLKGYNYLVHLYLEPAASHAAILSELSSYLSKINKSGKSVRVTGIQEKEPVRVPEEIEPVPPAVTLSEDVVETGTVEAAETESETGRLTLNLLKEFTLSGPSPAERGDEFLWAQGAKVMPDEFTGGWEQFYDKKPALNPGLKTARGLLRRDALGKTYIELAEKDPFGAETKAKKTKIYIPTEKAEGILTFTMVEVVYSTKDIERKQQMKKGKGSEKAPSAMAFFVKPIGAYPADMTIGTVQKLGEQYVLVPLFKENGNYKGAFGPIALKTDPALQVGDIMLCHVRPVSDGFLAEPMKRLGDKITPDIAAHAIALYNGARGYMEKGVIEQAEHYAKDEMVAREFDDLKKNASSEAAARMQDLRDLPFVTIDPIGAGDLDDAYYIEKHADGSYTWYLATANVGQFVRPGTPAFRAAAKIGNTFYSFNKDGVPEYPMNHPVVSKYVSSLLAGHDRLSMLTRMEFDAQGNMKESHVSTALVHVKGRYSYEQAAQLMRGEKGHGIKYEKQVTLAQELANKLKAMDHARGKMNLHFTMVRPHKDAAGIWSAKVQEEDPVLTESHQIIEELKVYGNRALAVILTEITEKYEVPHISRVHPPVDEDRNRQVRQKLAQAGLPWPDSMSMADYLAMLRQNTKLTEEAKEVMQSIVLQSRSTAIYQVMDKEGHEGLAFQPGEYDHPSAPIRRFSDTYNQNLLHAYLTGRDPREVYQAVLKDVRDMGFKDMEDFCEHINGRQSLSSNLERDYLKFISLYELAKPENQNREMSGYVRQVMPGNFPRVVIQLRDIPVSFMLEGTQASGLDVLNEVRVTIQGADLAESKVTATVVKGATPKAKLKSASTALTAATLWAAALTALGLTFGMNGLVVLGVGVSIPFLAQSAMIFAAAHEWLPDYGVIPEIRTAPVLQYYRPRNPTYPSRLDRWSSFWDRYKAAGVQMGEVAIRPEVMKRLPPRIQKWFVTHELNHLRFHDLLPRFAKSPWSRLVEEMAVSTADLLTWRFKNALTAYRHMQEDYSIRRSATVRSNPDVLVWLKHAHIPPELQRDVTRLLIASPDVWNFESVQRLIQLLQDPRIDDQWVQIIKKLAPVDGLSGLLRRVDFSVFDVQGDFDDWDLETLGTFRQFKQSLEVLQNAAALERGGYHLANLGYEMDYVDADGQNRRVVLDALAINFETGSVRVMVAPLHPWDQKSQGRIESQQTEMEDLLGERIRGIVSAFSRNFRPGGALDTVRRIEFVVPVQKQYLRAGADWQDRVGKSYSGPDGRSVELGVKVSAVHDPILFHPKGLGIQAHRGYVRQDADDLRGHMNALRLTRAMTGRVKVFATDIDDTQAYHNGVILPENQEFLKALLSNNMPVAIITGKSNMPMLLDKQLAPFLRSLKAKHLRNLYIYAASGSRVFQVRGYDAKRNQWITEEIWTHPLASGSPQALEVKKIVGGLFDQAIEKFSLKNSRKLNFGVGDVLEPSEADRHKLLPMAMFIESELNRHPWLVQEGITLSVTLGGGRDVGVDPSGKASALQDLMKRFGARPEEVFYMGDSFLKFGNDDATRRKFQNLNYAHVTSPVETTHYLQRLSDFLFRVSSKRSHAFGRAQSVKALSIAMLLSAITPTALFGAVVHGAVAGAVRTIETLDPDGEVDLSKERLVDQWVREMTRSQKIQFQTAYLSKEDMEKRFGSGSALSVSPYERTVFLRKEWIVRSDSRFKNILRSIALPILLNASLTSYSRPFRFWKYLLFAPLRVAEVLFRSARILYRQSLKPFLPSIWGRAELYQKITDEKQLDTPDIADNFLGKLEYDLEQWKQGKAPRPVVYIRNTGGGGDVLNNIYLAQRYKDMGAEVVLISIHQKKAGLWVPKDMRVRVKNEKEEDPVYKWDEKTGQYVYDHDAGYGRDIHDLEDVELALPENPDSVVNKHIFRVTPQTHIKGADAPIAESNLVKFMDESYGPANFYMVAMKDSPVDVARSEYELFKERFAGRNVYVVITGTGGDFISNEAPLKCSPVNEEYHMLVLRQMLKNYEKERPKSGFTWRSMIFQESSPGADLESSPGNLQKTLEILWEKRIFMGAMTPWNNAQGIRQALEAVRLGVASSANMEFIRKIQPVLEKPSWMIRFLARLESFLEKSPRVLKIVRALPLPGYFAFRKRLIVAGTIQRNDTYGMDDPIQKPGGLIMQDSLYFHWSRMREWLVPYTALPPPSVAKYLTFKEMAVLIGRTQGSTHEGVKPTEAETLILKKYHEMRQGPSAAVLRRILAGTDDDLMPADYEKIFSPYKQLFLDLLDQTLNFKLYIVSRQEDGKTLDPDGTRDVRLLILLMAQYFLDKSGELDDRQGHMSVRLLQLNPMPAPNYDLYVMPRVGQTVDVDNAVQFAKRIYQWRDNRTLTARLEQAGTVSDVMFSVFDLLLSPHQNAFVRRNIQYNIFDLALRAAKELNYVRPSLDEKKQALVDQAVAQIMSVAESRQDPKSLDISKSDFANALMRLARLYEKSELHRHLSGSLSPMLLMVLYWISPVARRDFIREMLSQDPERVDVDAVFAEYFGGPADPRRRAEMVEWLTSLGAENVRLGDPDFIKTLKDYFGTEWQFRQAIQRAERFIEYRPKKGEGTLKEYIWFNKTGEIPLRNNATANHIALRESILAEYYNDNVTVMELQMSGLRPGEQSTLPEIVSKYMKAFDEVDEITGGHARPAAVLVTRKEPEAILRDKGRSAIEASGLFYRQNKDLPFPRLVDALRQWLEAQVFTADLSASDLAEEKTWLDEFMEQLELFRESRRLNDEEFVKLVFLSEAARREQVQRVNDLIALRKDWWVTNPRYARRLVGIGSVGSEEDFFPWTMLPAMRLARRNGLKVSMHVGEAWRPQEQKLALLRVKQVISSGHVDRLEHITILGVLPKHNTVGYTREEILELRQLRREILPAIAKSRIPVVSMPTSNVRLSVVNDYKSHFLQFFYKLGINVAVAQDNSWIFDTRGASGERIKIWLAHPDMRFVDWLAIEQNGFRNAFSDSSLKETPLISNISQQWVAREVERLVGSSNHSRAGDLMDMLRTFFLWPITPWLRLPAGSVSMGALLGIYDKMSGEIQYLRSRRGRPVKKMVAPTPLSGSTRHLLYGSHPGIDGIRQTLRAHGQSMSEDLVVRLTGGSDRDGSRLVKNIADRLKSDDIVSVRMTGTVSGGEGAVSMNDVDRKIGRILEEARRQNARVVISADRPEYPYPSARMPFFYFDPSLSPRDPRSPELRRGGMAADVGPTVCHMMGLPSPEGDEGQSLLPSTVAGRQQKVILVVLDDLDLAFLSEEKNAAETPKMPYLTSLAENYPFTTLLARGSKPSDGPAPVSKTVTGPTPVIPSPAPNWSHNTVELVVTDLRGWVDIRADGSVVIDGMGRDLVREQIERAREVNARGQKVLFSLVLDTSIIGSDSEKTRFTNELIAKLAIPQEMVSDKLVFDVDRWKTPERIAEQIQSVSGRGSWRTWKVWILTHPDGAIWWEKVAQKAGWPTVAFQILNVGLRVEVTGAALAWLKSMLKDRYGYTEDDVARLLAPHRQGNAVVLESEKIGAERLDQWHEQQTLFNIQA